MRILFSSVLIASVFLGACAGKKDQTFQTPPAAATGTETTAEPAPVSEKKIASPKKSELIVTPQSSVTGKVVRYNDAGRFVVLDFPLGRVPAADQRMFLYRRGLKTAEVKISPWQRENLIVADIVTGDAQEGDEVRDK